MGDPWGIGSFRGGGKGLEGSNRKKKSEEKSGEKSEKKIRLKMVWKALGTPRNPFKS